MNVFVPYQSPLECAKALYGDRRFNKQIIECRQILDAIKGTGKGWFNHPVTKMYKPYMEWLVLYACCLQAYQIESKNVNTTFYTFNLYSTRADKIRPPFLTEDFCNQHKRRLYTKNPDHYKQFAEYGKSEENWYYDNEAQKIIKYINGKRIE